MFNLLWLLNAFILKELRFQLRASNADFKLSSYIPSREVEEIKDVSARRMIDSIEYAPIKLIAGDDIPGVVNTSFVSYSYQSSIAVGDRNNKIETARLGILQNLLSAIPFVPSSGVKRKSPILLIPGFDGSCLEYRKLAPLLIGDRDIFVLDVLGWGFSGYDNIKDFSAQAKINHIREFIKQKIGMPVTLVGCSLGGAMAIITAVDYPELVDKLVLIDAQGFTDGSGPSDIPDAFARYLFMMLKFG